MEIGFPSMNRLQYFCSAIQPVVKKIIPAFLCALLIPVFSIAQDSSDTAGKGKPDSLAKQPTSVKAVQADTGVRKIPDSLRLPDTTVRFTPAVPTGPDTAATYSRIRAFQLVLKNHPYYRFFSEPLNLTIQEKERSGSEEFFYLLLALFFFYALVRVLFYKYLSNIFTLFFRATLRQQQIREQLTQSPLPSLLLNILFVLTGGLYVAMLSRHYNYLQGIDFWLVCLYTSGGLMLVYIGKFLVLKTLGWILRISKATDAYLFTVFMVNKIIGIFLLPVLLCLAFPYPGLLQVVITLSFFVLALLWGYRFLLSYRAVRTEIRINPFHFFLYLCAFEIAPLLLIYKVLLSIVERTN